MTHFDKNKGKRRGRDGAGGLSYGDLPGGDERLADWVDGTLSGRDRERFEAELRVSPHLREQVAEYERTVASVRMALQAPTQATDLADRVMARIADGGDLRGSDSVARDADGRRRPRGWSYVWAALSAAALLMVAVWVDSWGHSSGDATADALVALEGSSDAADPDEVDAESERQDSPGNEAPSRASRAQGRPSRAPSDRELEAKRDGLLRVEGDPSEPAASRRAAGGDTNKAEVQPRKERVEADRQQEVTPVVGGITEPARGGPGAAKKSIPSGAVRSVPTSSPSVSGDPAGGRPSAGGPATGGPAVGGALAGGPEAPSPTVPRSRVMRRRLGQSPEPEHGRVRGMASGPPSSSPAGDAASVDGKARAKAVKRANKPQANNPGLPQDAGEAGAVEGHAVPKPSAASSAAPFFYRLVGPETSGEVLAMLTLVGAATKPVPTPKLKREKSGMDFDLSAALPGRLRMFFDQQMRVPPVVKKDAKRGAADPVSKSRVANRPDGVLMAGLHWSPIDSTSGAGSTNSDDRFRSDEVRGGQQRDWLVVGPKSEVRKLLRALRSYADASRRTCRAGEVRVALGGGATGSTSGAGTSGAGTSGAGTSGAGTAAARRGRDHAKALRVEKEVSTSTEALQRVVIRFRVLDR